MSKQMTVKELASRIADGQLERGELLILDVREVKEFNTGHIAGSINIPMALIPLRVSEIRRSATIAVICEAGGRSSQSAAWLETNGFDASSITGGIGYWKSEKFPVEI